jgi:hypothetical protein
MCELGAQYYDYIERKRKEKKKKRKEKKMRNIKRDIQGRSKTYSLDLNFN